MRKYRIKVDERYRWSRPDQWYEYYDTREEAQRRIDEIRRLYDSHEVVPDYYCSGYDLILVDCVEKQTS